MHERRQELLVNPKEARIIRFIPIKLASEAHPVSNCAKRAIVWLKGASAHKNTGPKDASVVLFSKNRLPAKLFTPMSITGVHS